MEKRKQRIDVPPKPWSHNPSSWNQRVRIAVVAIFAVAISFYMGLFQWGLIDSVWDPVFGEQSERVLRSDVSHQMSGWFRLPDAVLGSLAYLGDIIFALAGSTRRWQYRPWLVLLFGLDVIPLGIVSAILVFLQATIVGNWCFLCLVTAVISLILVVMAYDEVTSTVIYLYRLWKETRSGRVMWQSFWGRPTEEAYKIGLTMIKE